MFNMSDLENYGGNNSRGTALRCLAFSDKIGLLIVFPGPSAQLAFQ